MCLVLFATLLAGCASGGATLLEPQIDIAQMPDNFDLLAFPGDISIRYQITVGNPSSETITLERIELGTNGPGPYSASTQRRAFGVVLAPDEIVTFDFPVDAVSRGDKRITKEPVTLRGTVYFAGPHGEFSKSFFQVIRGPSPDKRANPTD